MPSHVLNQLLFHPGKDKLSMRPNQEFSPNTAKSRLLAFRPTDGPQNLSSHELGIWISSVVDIDASLSVSQLFRFSSFQYHDCGRTLFFTAIFLRWDVRER
jgi:hypothetical protein